MSALAGVRAIIHALRAWRTPLGVAINSRESVFDEQGEVADREVAPRLEFLGRQVVAFGRIRRVGPMTRGVRLSSVDAAVAALRGGEMIVVTDAPDREN